MEARRWRPGAWLAELLLVFIGVYGAFWLNTFQEHRRDLQRRNQILLWLEQAVEEGLDSSRANAERQEKVAAEFRRALDTGEMPPLRAFSFVADYSPNDIATLLQAGGIELLDPATLSAARNNESIIRAGFSLMEHYE